MFFERAYAIACKGKTTVETERQYGLCKILKYLLANFFKYTKLIIYETHIERDSLPDIVHPRINNVELKFISSEKEVEELKNSGYSFGIYPCLKVDKARFKAGAQMTAVFVDRELAYRNWLGLTRESALKFGPFLKHLGYEEQVSLYSFIILYLD